jgi:hypothetical protein
LYGLPRAFEDHVLPSLIENVIKPNYHYDCDYFVHFFNKTLEDQGRSGVGGSIDATSVLQLKRVIQELYQYRGRAGTSTAGGGGPTVQFVIDTESDFESERKRHIVGITTNSNDTAINPYLSSFSTGTSQEPLSTVMNVLKMWHSQTKVFELMEQEQQQRQQQQHDSSYTRVAMLRLDVIYMTPIDIYRVCDDPVLPFTQQSVDERRGSTFRNPLLRKDRKERHGCLNHFYDIHNQYVVIPGFASYPVNDRLIIGPYDAVKVWATQRWNLYEQHVRYLQANRNDDDDVTSAVPFGLHDESVVGYTILPTIEKNLRYKVMMDRRMYFLRVRADGSIWILDSPYNGKVTEKDKLEALLKRKCTDPYEVPKIIASGRWQLKCPVVSEGAPQE